MCTAWCARGIKPRTNDANLYWRTLLASMSQHGNTRHGCTTPSCSAFDGHLRLSLHRNLRANGFRSGSFLQEGPRPGLVWPRTPKALAMSASRNAKQTNRGLHWLTDCACQCGDSGQFWHTTQTVCGPIGSSTEGVNASARMPAPPHFGLPLTRFVAP